MVEHTPDDDDLSEQETERQYERIASTSESHKAAWEATIGDMNDLAAEREEDGWDTVTIMAGSTAPEAPHTEPEGRFGLTHVIPGNKVEAFEDAHADGEFPLYDVYQGQSDGQIFLVTELLNPETETAILIAANTWRFEAGPLVEAAVEAETMYTHVETLDGTHLGSFEHEEYEKFFPDPESIIGASDAMKPQTDSDF